MANIFYDKAKEHYAAKRLKEAIDDFSEAIIVEPNNADIYADRAVAYFHLQEFSLALKDKNKAVELEPQKPYRYSSRAYIKSAMGDVEGAIDDYKKCIELDPEDSIAYNNLGLLEEKLGYISKSKERFKKADDISERLGLNFYGNTQQSEPPKQNLTEPNFIEEDKPFEGNILTVVKEVFTTKKGFNEFIRFVKGGLKKRE
jgi:tetratricopeptide (TPR) repeat protein